MKLKLPDVTLVCVETREHELASMAIDDCLDKADFAEVLVVTDNPGKFQVSSRVYNENFPARFHIVQDWPDKLGWSRSWWFDVPPLLRTRQTLNIQWDSWIWDASMWRDEWLDYDYIGAPWWHKDGKNVGNGGFSLISTALKRYIWKRRDQYPCDTSIDDDLLCRTYRPHLEAVGFRWAAERVASEFSWEGCSQPKTEQTHFGFHAMFNWPLVLDRGRLMQRLEVVLRSPNLTNPKSYQLRSFCEMHPVIARELLDKTEPHLKIRS